MGETKENNVLFHAAVQGESERFSLIGRTWAKAVQEVSVYLSLISNTGGIPFSNFLVDGTMGMDLCTYNGTDVVDLAKAFSKACQQQRGIIDATREHRLLPAS